MSKQTEISSIEIDLTLYRGRNLVAKDKNIFGKKTSSDPYVKVYICGKYQGQSKVVYKNLNPTWNTPFKLNFNTQESNYLYNRAQNGEPLTYTLCIFDHDEFTEDDNMGIVNGIISLTDPPSKKWMPVEKEKGFTKTVTGDIEVKTALSIRKLLTAVRGNSLSLSDRGLIDVKLDWKFENGLVDLDTSCVGVDRFGNVLMDETVYFGDLVNSNRSIIHSGDVQSGGGKGEVITCNLSAVKRRVQALYFILTVATPGKSFEDVKSASVIVLDKTSQCNLCTFTPSLVGDNTAMFLMRMSRQDTGHGWKMTVIEDTDHTARDFGSLIPEIKGYCRDFAPHIKVNPHERIAIMRKGGAVRLRDYSHPNQPVPDRVTFGLAWDITNGKNVDLDASAICLNSSFEVVDIISYQKLKSNDLAIVHGGDEREGDEIGDDEKIFLYLKRMNPSISYIGFVINSYSGQELDDVSKASCHLFDSTTRVDIAKYSLTNNRSLDKRTGLIMSVLYLDETGSWCMRVVSEPGNGRIAQDLVGQLQSFLKNNPPPTVQEVPEPEIIVNAMPEEVEIPVAPSVLSHEFANNTFIPPAQASGKTNESTAPMIPTPGDTNASNTPVIPSFSQSTAPVVPGGSNVSTAPVVPTFGD
jgi:tellurium resistance protein TerZ